MKSLEKRFVAKRFFEMLLRPSLLDSNVLDFDGQVLDYEEQAQMDQVSVALITKMSVNLALCMPAGRDSP